MFHPICQQRNEKLPYSWNWRKLKKWTMRSGRSGAATWDPSAAAGGNADQRDRTGGSWTRGHCPRPSNSTPATFPRAVYLKLGWGPVLFLFSFSICWGTSTSIKCNKKFLKRWSEQEDIQHTSADILFMCNRHKVPCVNQGDVYRTLPGKLFCNREKQEVTHVSSDRTGD